MAVGQKFVKQEFDETAKDNVCMLIFPAYFIVHCKPLSNPFMYPPLITLSVITPTVILSAVTNRPNELTWRTFVRNAEIKSY